MIPDEYNVEWVNVSGILTRYPPKFVDLFDPVSALIYNVNVNPIDNAAKKVSKSVKCLKNFAWATANHLSLGANHIHLLYVSVSIAARQWLKWFCKAGGGAHLTKPGWIKPHTHSNPTFI